ncbi:hypothetical protein ASD64_05060 [Mesorhizobium sp. Root157]|uniref:porin n=1 Tax=Mesorhizobium sp. Root157 TaxID=1736477 RepID=UPI000713B0D1|nr:porin [Mesorhizobium sp. Root157]KQZ94236.1 hypothetical protein ASD64_05060 [Mesorhizobium sp. Root157]
MRAPPTLSSEYVKICDVYGAGYYYIPGTETCLKISGLVRYQISFSEDDDGWRKNALGRLNVDANSETELGTLAGHLRLESSVDSSNTSANVELVHATISLGGLSMGLNDTAYDFGLDTSNLGGAEFDSYGGDSVHFVRYTFDAANGISATISLEEEHYDSDYVPNVVGAVNVAQGWGGLTVAVAYDDDDNTGADDEFFLKGVARINVNPQLELALLGIYESGNGFYSTGYEWSVGAYASYKATDKITLGLGGQYWADSHAVAGVDAWSIGGDVKYQIVSGFSTKLQVQYDDVDGVDGNFNGWLRFERSF